ncbi:amidohydrolase [Caldalkalibacillus salinus]|uniref:amidohydrolase n=1 Tax=Caldalkalibacillus salinus TaxID=2803787 RepID=UPI001F0127D4|nr:amidohydrolase [Caldalkalibacillus salinus]
MGAGEITMDKRFWADFLARLRPQLTEWRRDFHQHPELGWTEYRTTYHIAQILKPLGFDITVGKDVLVSEERMGVPTEEELHTCEQRAVEEGVPEAWVEKMQGGHTGLVAQWDTGRPGPHFAFRFDIDALPILESQEDSHLPQQHGFRSRHEGEMHACGHDGHATIGLGLAHWIKRMKDELDGRFTLLFQPAEEGSRGAKAMVEKGWLDDVDYFLSGHIGIQSLPVGHVVATTSGFLATTKMNVLFHGTSAHAGFAPEQGKNALLAAAATALHLQGITRHSEGATRINVGTLEAGSGRNIIADFGKIQLETRGETTALNQYMVQEAQRIIQATARLYDVDVEIDIVGEGIGTESDQAWISVVEQACASSEHIQHVAPHIHAGGSEDVTYMMNRVQDQGGQATYMVFGTPLPAGHHHPQFDYDEDVLAVAVEALGRTVAYQLSTSEE